MMIPICACCGHELHVEYNTQSQILRVWPCDNIAAIADATGLGDANTVYEFHQATITANEGTGGVKAYPILNERSKDAAARLARTSARTGQPNPADSHTVHE